METVAQYVCHDSKYKSANIGGHVVTAAVSAAALAALFKYVRQPSLAVLTGSSVACRVLPGAALIPMVRAVLSDTSFSPTETKVVRTGMALSSFVAGAQMVLIGLAALRTWNSGLSRLKKMGIGVALSASIAELVVVKVCAATFLACVAAHNRSAGGEPYPEG